MSNITKNVQCWNIDGNIYQDSYLKYTGPTIEPIYGVRFSVEANGFLGVDTTVRVEVSSNGNNINPVVDTFTISDGTRVLYTLEGQGIFDGITPIENFELKLSHKGSGILKLCDIEILTLTEFSPIPPTPTPSVTPSMFPTPLPVAEWQDITFASFWDTLDDDDFPIILVDSCWQYTASGSEGINLELREPFYGVSFDGIRLTLTVTGGDTTAQVIVSHSSYNGYESVQQFLENEVPTTVTIPVQAFSTTDRLKLRMYPDADFLGWSGTFKVCNIEVLTTNVFVEPAPLPAGTITPLPTIPINPTPTPTPSFIPDLGEPFMFTVDPSENLYSSPDVKLEIFGPASGRIDWGYDDAPRFEDFDISSGSMTFSKTYSNTSEKTVKIYGTAQRIVLGKSSSVRTIKKVLSFGDLGLTSLDYTFYNLQNLVQVPPTLPSTVTSLVSTFENAELFNQDISGWDTTNVTNMSGMFSGTNNFNKPLNSWNVSNVTNMSSMFRGAGEFNKPLNSWDVSNVTNMSSMFRNAISFNQPLDSWNVSNVTDISYMFDGAYEFNQPLNSWNVSNVTDMSYMFYGATTFNQPLGFWNVSNVTNMSSMFRNAEAFNQPLNSWNVSNVTDMSYMFSGADTFNQPLNSWDVSNVTNMSSMFRNAEAFNQPLDSWNVSNVTDMSYMFDGADTFNQPLNSWDVSNVTNMSSMFKGADTFNQSLNSWDVSNVTNMSSMFGFATSFNQDISYWDVSNVTNMDFMFYNATSFNQDLSSWCVEQISSAPFWFSNNTPAWVLPKPNWGAPC